MKFVNDPTTDADDRAHLEQVRSDAWLWPGVIVIIVVGSLLLSGFSRDEKIRDKAMSGVGGITLGIFGYLKGRSDGKRSGGMLVPEPGDMPEPTPPSRQRPEPMAEPEPLEPVQQAITTDIRSPDIGLQEDRGIQRWDAEPTQDEPKNPPGFHYQAIQSDPVEEVGTIEALRERALTCYSRDLFQYDSNTVDIQAYRASGRVEEC